MKTESKKRVSIRKIMGWKYILACALCCLLFLSMLLLNFRELMQLGQENAYRNCQNVYLLTATQLDDYLFLTNEAVSSAARRIEEMRAGGESSEDIRAYMVRESQNLDSRIAGPTSVVYGYIGGTFLYGGDWEPGADFDATTRPWYGKALSEKGAVTHVPPYTDAVTGEQTITVCIALSDGVSVVAMDLSTQTLQNVVNEISRSSGYFSNAESSNYGEAQVFVMDSDGAIIAHSLASKQLKNYIDSDDPVERELAEHILKSGDTFFQIEENGKPIIYSGSEIENGWYVFSGLAYREVSARTLRNLYISIAAALLGIGGMILVMIRLARRRYQEAAMRDHAEEVEKENRYLTELMRARQESEEAKAAYEKEHSASAMYSSIAHALSASYSYLYYVDLETDDYDDYSRERVDEDLPEEERGHDFFNTSRQRSLQVLHPEDQESFLAAFTKENILQTIDREGSFKISYRHLVNGVTAYVTMNVTRLQEDDRHILVGVNNNGDVDARNELTGLHTEAALSVRGKEVLQAHPEGWCLIALDLEHFRLFNEWYGREAGDRLLAQIGERLARVEEETEGLACYLGQDDFVLIVSYDEESVQRLFQDVHEFVMEHGSSVGFMPAIGVCMEEGGISVEEMFDRALQASQHAKEDYHHRIRIFEESMFKKTEQDYQILSDFQQALQDQELFIQLQPQCEIEGGKVVGAESLVRWKKADGTMVSPGVFVPVLEQYGFVTDLDQFVWEEVCAWQKSWIDSGHTPLPISVNVSQIDIFTIDVPSHFALLMWKYKLPVDVIKIEITESAYVGDNAVADTVKRLREKGFLVLMDDFGSGYSSLNMLRSLNVDIIKLDAKFLRMNSDDRKGIHILESIVGMAKSMETPIIVEGVETQQETEFIASLGCRYVQGYHFYRPMPVPDFEALIGNEGNIDTSGFSL